MSRQRLRQINSTRKARADVRSREVANEVALGKSVKELAVEKNVTVRTINRDLARYRERGKNAIEGEVAQEQLGQILEKWDEIESDKTMTGAEKHLAWARWMKLQIMLTGTAAPTRAIVGHVKGPQLDALYLDVRQELLNLSDEDKQEALRLMREFAKSRRKPVVVDAMLISEGDRADLS